MICGLYDSVLVVGTLLFPLGSWFVAPTPIQLGQGFVIAIALSLCVVGALLLVLFLRDGGSLQGVCALYRVSSRWAGS